MSKTILITGASSGIGRASAKLFAANGWQVVATMRNSADGADLAGPDTLVTRLDVEDDDSIADAVRAAVARFGSIDVLLNNAGYGQNGLFEATPHEKIVKQFAINLFGVMQLTREVLPLMRARQSGMVINVGSGAGIFGLPGISTYNASKFALSGWSESLSYELASQGITVKLIEPHGGVTETAFRESAATARAPEAPPADYAGFVARTDQAFAAMAAASNMSSADVAAVIYGAATDGTDALRYPVGDDARGFVKARRPDGDEPYMRLMRGFFPKA
jgi:NAD(P)-dependent dehydrogenase (short-subunit alcohol dehydrogenase family)